MDGGIQIRQDKIKSESFLYSSSVSMLEGKMRRFCFTILCLSFLAFNASGAQAAWLYDWAFNVNRVYYDQNTGSGNPPGSFVGDWMGAAGVLTVTCYDVGDNFILSLFDVDLDLDGDSTNDSGAIGGTLEAGQSWEIDDPVAGDLYTNLGSGNLDNNNSVPQSGEVAFGLGWDFYLNAGQFATVIFTLGDTAPASGFYLHQSDGNENLYLSSDLSIDNLPTPIPVPAPIFLLGSGFAGIGAWRVRKFKK